MKIAFVASEAFPYVKTGGLADVAGALPKVLSGLGCEIKLFIPKYGSIDEKKFRLDFVDKIKIPVKIGEIERTAFLHRAKLDDSKVEVNFIDCPYYFFRSSVYTNDPDEDERFILFNKAIINLLEQDNWIPDIIHCNDWQTGLLPYYIKENKKFKTAASIFTIHNIGYQGNFDEQTYQKAGVSVEKIAKKDFESFHSFSFMKTGLLFSDLINTVSQTYALEILTPEYSAGMDKILEERKTDLFGILNGIDFSEWNPLTDENIPFHFNFENIKGKERTKRYLLDKYKIKYEENIPVIGIVSRMAGQKGFDIFAEAANELMQLNVKWIILGNGENRYEDLFNSLTHHYPEKVAVYIGYNNSLAHLIEAGADMFLMPSHYEPCGLNQLYSLRYGTVPVVRKTGGLADTVKDWHEFKDCGSVAGTGFTFKNYSAFELYKTVKRAVETFRDKETWRQIQKNGMSADFSWEHSGKDYLDLYKRAFDKKKD